MSYKRLAIIGIVAAGMVVWALVQSNLSKRPEGGFAAQTGLMQGLDPSAIGSIVLQSEGNTVTLLRQDRAFVVVEKDKYPAMMKQINGLLSACIDIKTTELITSDKANYAQLGVSDDKPKIAIKFLKPDKSILAGILVGKSGDDPIDLYVRLISSDKVYMATKVPPLRTDAMDYIDKKLVDINDEEIGRVSVESTEGSYAITRGSDRGIVLDNIPAGKAAKSNELQQVFFALSNPLFKFVDVKKDSGKMKFDRTYVCELNDSTVYTIQLSSKGNKTYSKWTADVVDKSDVVKESYVESKEALKAKEAKLLALDKTTDFMKRTQGWVYELPEKETKSMTMKFADLLRDESENPADANNTKK